jgi:Spy/CpxP family protein refolding chaperone
MQTRFSKNFSRAALVASLAIGSALAFAQPGTGGSPGEHRMHKMQGEHGGRGGHGGHGGHGEAHIAQRMEMLKAKLNLNATQEAQYNVARDATKAAMDAGRTARLAARTSAQAELNKADPDLAALLLQRENLKDANATQRKAALNEWAKFLGLLTTEQKSIVKSQLLSRMQRMPGA